MRSDEKFFELKGILKDLEQILPEKVFERVACVEKMKLLWSLLDEELQIRCAPRNIHKVIENGREITVCEIWADDNLTIQILKRVMTPILREVAEKLGRVEFEEVRYKVVTRQMLLEQLIVMKG